MKNLFYYKLNNNYDNECYFNNRNDNYYFHISLCRIIFTFFIVFYGLFFCYSSSNAMKVSTYSYKTIYDNLPSGLQNNAYVYEIDGVTKIAFATNKTTGADYRSSIKHSDNTLYYCIDYSTNYTDNKDFINNDSMYSDELRARIGLAIHLGTSQWNTKASKAYTNGNFLVDYYMTQIVIHALIYKFDEKNKDHGVDFDSISFKSGTGNLKKNTAALFNDCCKAIYSDSTGSFQSVNFTFYKDNHSIFKSIDGETLVSDEIACITDSNNAGVNEFMRKSHLRNSANEEVMSDIAVNNNDNYNSSFHFSIPINTLDRLNPDVYTASIEQTTSFHRVLAKEYLCSTKGFINNQAVVGYSTTDINVSDDYSLSFLIGAVELEKKDSITGEIIKDAKFKLLQYDNSTGKYLFYKDLFYDDNQKKYLSGNIYISSFNPEGKFKVIEETPGKNYINDWNGHEFVLTPDNLIISIEAENAPVLGKLRIHKDGNSFNYLNDKQIFDFTDTKIVIPGVQFQIYANEDIYFKDILMYKKDQKIFDITTDEQGEAVIEEMFPGKYYIKESNTNSLYILNSDSKEFEIKKEDGKYKDITFTFLNDLKKCEIKLYKYTKNINSDNNSENIPLSGCKFALYSKEDIKDVSGNIIVSKDTKIMEASSNSKGEVLFGNLPYSDYYIKELEVPRGIVISDKVINITKDNYTIKTGTTGEYETKVDIYNKKQKYNINLYKYGEQFLSSTQKESDNGVYYEYSTGYDHLKDVTYDLYNSQDQKLMSKTTDDKGLIEFGPIEYGEYYCIERSAPEQYTIDTTPVKFSCTQLKEENPDDSSDIITIEQSVNNNLCSCSIDILKLGEAAVVRDNIITYEYVPLEGIIYGLYQDFEFTFPSGDKLPVNTCLGYISTDSLGKGQFNAKLPQGNYHLQELRTLNGYDIEQTVHTFEIKANNNNNVTIDLTNEPFRNYLSKSGVTIIKTDDQSDKKLKGVEFTLYDDSDNKIGVYTTNKNGEIIVDNLPYGNYYFIESKTLKGYYSSNNKYNFTLNSPEYVNLNITNTPILQLGFNEHYKLYFALFCLIILAGGVYIYINETRRKKCS